MSLRASAPAVGGGHDEPVSTPTASDLAAERDVWVRMLIGWHVAFWLMLGVAAVFTTVSTELTRGDRVRIGGLLAVLAVGYLVGVMRNREAARGPSGHAYVVLAIVVVGLACSVDTSMAMLLFVVFPQVWMFTPTARWGMVGCIALTIVAIGGMGVDVGWHEGVMRNLVPQMVISLLFSILLGFWISRVIEQSRQRADLIEELERARSQLATAHHAQGVMAERERMAQEIHDTLAQGFTSIVTLSQVAHAGLAQAQAPERDLERIATIEAVARENLAEARALVAAFTPVDLVDATLADAVRRLGERFAERTGARVEVDVSQAPAALSREAEVVLLRAAQEALANVGRHARARSVVLRLVGDGDQARVEVTDDGVGFPAELSEGFGLSGMRARVGQAGGQVAVDSEVGRGTRVVVRIPVRAVSP